MKRFLLKSVVYACLIVLLLECMVRLIHLHKDTPYRYIDDRDVEKWVPGQHGFSVTGNRKQNFSEYRINQSGYNSYREFTPSEDGYEIALVGDSFIEGFHQPFYNSIGKKIEEMWPGTEVYEYGYAGYDLADQLHLIDAYQMQFNKIDKVVIYLKYPDDLYRDEHQISMDRIRLDAGLYRILKSSKLLVYAQNIGLINAITSKVSRLKNYLSAGGRSAETEVQQVVKDDNELYLKNFIKLTQVFTYDKSKFVLLLDARDYPESFLSYLDKEKFQYIDYGLILKSSSQAVTLIYDQHWNNHGRELIAKAIAEKISAEALSMD